MALAVAFRFSFVDSKNKASFTKVSVPNGFSIANYVEFGQGLAQLFANLSEGQLTKVSFTASLDLSTATIKAGANVLADVGQKAYMKFASAVSGFSRQFWFPAMDEQIGAPNSDSILAGTDPNVDALVTAIEDGIVVTGGTVTPTDNRAQDLVSLTEAKKRFRNRS